MQKQRFLSAAMVLTAGLGISVNAAAAAPTCHGTAAAVSGSVTTFNTSATQQQGQVNLTLTAMQDGSAVLFSDSGMISGEVTNQHGTRSRLNHQMVFSSGEALNTHNDIAISKLPPIAYEADATPCAFNVVESITKFSGTGRFEHVKGAIVAEGTISFCSTNNRNNFTLSGVVCLKD